MRSRIVIGCMAAVALTLALPSEAAPQGRQPLVLQHGFMSSAGTWDQTAPWFEQYLYATTSRYTTGWNSSFVRQANRLRESITHLPDTTILIGHSNGGLISRRVANIRATKGFMTVGTPHRGVPLAENLLNGNVGAFAWFIHYFAKEVIGIYGRPEYDHSDDWVRHVGLWAAEGEAWVGKLIYALAGTMNVLDAVGETVLTDMRPGSAFLSFTSGINSTDALDQEAAVVGGPRVAFQTTVRATYFPQWMIWKGLIPAVSTEMSLATDATIVTLFMAYDHYASYYHSGDYYSSEKQAYADRWLWAAAALAGMDVGWCALIGAGASFGCAPADGIVPLTHQVHPGPGVSNIRLFGPAHQEQINSSEFRNAARDALQNTFKVRYPDAPPAHPLAVSIEGSNGTWVGYHTNTAHATGGTSGYSYRWFVSGDGNYFQDTGVTTPDYTHHVDVGQMFWIMVVVTAGSEQASGTKVLGPVCNNNCY